MHQGSRAPSARRDVLLLLAGLALLYFPLLGARPLSNPDEGRYVEIAREMTADGDWVSPRLNGVLYFEKPPLVYWLEATAVAAGGVNGWAARFWPAALALLGCAAVYAAGRAVWGRGAGWWAGWVLGTGILYYAMGQIVILDMAVSAFITGAMVAFMLAVREPPGARRRWLCWAMYACMALAVLAKGLIGIVIPAGIVFLWLLLLNRWRELRHAYLGTGIPLFLLIALPWHLAATFAHPPPAGWDWAQFWSKDRAGQGFLWFYLMHEHVWRYLDPDTSNRVQPFWFFFAILPAGFIPWVVFLPQTLRGACAGGWRKLRSEPETVLLFLWVLFPLLFFSKSSSKLIPYILPCVSPLALLTGRFLANAWNTDNASALRWPLRMLGAFGLALAVALPIVLSSRREDIPPEGDPWFYALTAMLVCAGASVLWLTFRARPDFRKALVIVAAALAAFLLAFNPIARFVQRPSTENLAQWLSPRLAPGDVVLTLWDYGPFQDLPAHLGRTVGIAMHLPDEQTFGLVLETERHAPLYPGIAEYLALAGQPGATRAQLDAAHIEGFLRLWNGPSRVYAVVRAQQFIEFQKRFPEVSAHEAWRDGAFVLFSNQPPPPQN